MSKDKPVKKVITSQPSASKTRTASYANSRNKKSASIPLFQKGGTMIIGKKNLIIMVAGVALIGLGMILMSGGGMKDPNEWKPEVIYSTRITVIAPILILAGLGIQIWSIFAKDKSEEVESV